jgi:hypothetical protein
VQARDDAWPVAPASTRTGTCMRMRRNSGCSPRTHTRAHARTHHQLVGLRHHVCDDGGRARVKHGHPPAPPGRPPHVELRQVRHMHRLAAEPVKPVQTPAGGCGLGGRGGTAAAWHNAQVVCRTGHNALCLAACQQHGQAHAPPLHAPHTQHAIQAARQQHVVGGVVREARKAALAAVAHALERLPGLVQLVDVVHTDAAVKAAEAFGRVRACARAAGRVRRRELMSGCMPR